MLPFQIVQVAPRSIRHSPQKNQMKKKKSEMVPDTFEPDELVLPEEDFKPMPGLGSPGDVLQRTVELAESGWRLDLFLAHHYPSYSRTHVRNAIVAGAVLIDPETEYSTHGKPSFRLKPDQVVRFTLPEIPREAPLPEPIPLDILYEDDDLVAVNKPAGMVVHPSRGHWSGTLVAALAHHFGTQLSGNRGPSRPGIVHRLDRDTSGIILVAKNDFIHARLAALFEERMIRKEYFAIVLGDPHLDRDMIDAPIGLHPKIRERMCIASPRDDSGKEAQTFYEVIKRYGKMASVRCLPKTGRTHQIRVHLTHTGYPILCDRLYGGRKSVTRDELLGKRPMALVQEEQQPDSSEQDQPLLTRQALHAYKLSFVHPITGQELELTAPIAEDIQSVLDVLETRNSG